MIVRYGKTKNNKTVKVASIFTEQEHSLSSNLIDKDALNIIRKLNSYGFKAYVVGGAVRDLLLHKTPKDFDIVTDAHPGRIKKIFRNSRIIGKRFRLVQVFYGREKIIEVSTFRSLEDSDHNAVYGKIDEDVKRRDFTINALYYCPLKNQIIDYVDGFRDLNNKTIKSIIPLSKTFYEDPVRMIRAIKYASNLDFSIPWRLKSAIKKHAHLIKECSTSRLTEELFKILLATDTSIILDNFIKLKIFQYFQPNYFTYLSNNNQYKQEFMKDIRKISTIHSRNSFEKRRRRLACYVSCIANSVENEPRDQIHKQFYLKIKELLLPLTPPNADVDSAVQIVLQKHGIRNIRTHYRNHKKRAGTNQ